MAIDLPDGQQLAATTTTVGKIQHGLIAGALAPTSSLVSAALPRWDTMAHEVVFNCTSVTSGKVGRLLAVRVTQKGNGLTQWFICDSAGTSMIPMFTSDNELVNDWINPARDFLKITGNGALKWTLKATKLDQSPDAEGWAVFIYDEWVS